MKLELFKKNELLTIQKKEEELKINEKKIIAQKNILKQEEYNKLLLTYKKEVKEFIKYKKKIYDEKNINKKKLTKKFIELLNPVLTNYVEDNSISILLEKNNILIGKKSLDVTEEIIKLLNEKNIEIN